MWIRESLSFLRVTPTLEICYLLIVWFLMRRAWDAAAHDPKELDALKRQAGATAITNQINGVLTAASILLAAVGAVLALGLDRNLPLAALNHLRYAAIEALVSIILGAYTLGYIPSVIHVFDVTKKQAVQLACFLQLNVIIVATVRFLLALCHLS